VDFDDGSSVEMCLLDCEPSCAGKECGGDGCGSSCGKCPEGRQCEGFTCEIGPCMNECYPGSQGCYNETPWSCVLNWVTNCHEAVYGEPCGEDLVCDDGWCIETPCVPDCQEKECGSDGCGGSCGGCYAESACEQGICVTVVEAIEPQPDVFYADVRERTAQVELEVTVETTVGDEPIVWTSGARRGGCNAARTALPVETLVLVLLLCAFLFRMRSRSN